MKCKQLGLRVLSTAAIMSIVSSIAMPAFADIYYLGDLGSNKDGYTIKVDENGNITVNDQKDGDGNVIIRGGTAADYNDTTTTSTDSADSTDTDGQTIGESAPITQEAAEEEQPVVTEEAEEQPEEKAEEKETSEEEAEQKEETAEESEEKSEEPKEEEKQEEPKEEEEQEPVKEEETEEDVEEESKETAAATQEAPSAAAPVNNGDSQTSTKREAPDTKMEQDTPAYTPDAPTSNAVDKVITVINDWVNNTFKFTIENVNINNTNTSKAAMSIQGKGNTTIELDGNNQLTNKNEYGHYNSHAALEKNGNSDVTGTLTITDTDAIDGDDSKRGSLTAIVNNNYTGAAIGGAYQNSGENITIEGNAYVSASANSVGIGGGSQNYGAGQDGNNITIGGNSYVVAKGGERAIGGSSPGNFRSDITPTNGNAKNIHITGTSTVYADGGIGGGQYAFDGNSETQVTIDGNSTVYAKAGYGKSAISGGAGGTSNITIGGNSKIKATLTNDTGDNVGIGTRGRGTITIKDNAIIGDGSASIGGSISQSNSDRLENADVTVNIQDNATVGLLDDSSYIGADLKKETANVTVNILADAIIKKVSRIGTKNEKTKINLFDNVTIGEVGAIGSYGNSSEITIGGSSKNGEEQDGTVTINANCKDIYNKSLPIGSGHWAGPSNVTIAGNTDLTLKSANGYYINKSSDTPYTDEELKQMLVNANAVGSTIKLVDKDDNVLRIIHTDDLCEPAKDADGNEIVISSTPSTCKTKGSQTFLCGYEKNHGATAASESASHTKELPLDPNNHEGGTEIRNAKPATCTENGYTGDKVCKGCDAVITPGTVIPATNHAHTHVINAKAATCTEDGYTGDTYCDDCKQTIATGAAIEKLNHNWDEGTITTAPTCTEPGVRTYTCQNDASHTYTEPVPATGHQHTRVEGQKDATDTEPGYTGDTVCDDCGAVIGKGKEIPATGHQHTEVIGAKDPTCTEPGYTGDTVCKDCGEIVKKGEEIPATGHQHTHIEGQKDATDTEPSYTGDTVCDDCGAVIGKGESIPAKGVPADENNESVSTPELWVVAPDTIRQTFTVRQNGTERIYTSPYNSGTLTGTMEILQYLQEQGVETIVFTTNQRTSRFAVADLLALVGEGDVFYLRHMDAAEPTLLVIANDHSDLLNG